jgi:phage gpG-like protein
VVTVEVIETPESRAAEMLKRLRMKMPGIDRRLRVMFAGQIVGDIQKNYLRGQVLHRRSGDLSLSIAYRDASVSETMVGSYGPPYARIHELGGVIHMPSRGQLALHGRFATTKRALGKRNKKVATYRLISGYDIKMPKRPYLLPGITNYFNSGEAGRDSERFLQLELDRVERG